MPKSRIEVTPEQLEALPVFYRKTIPEDYLDIMGHMNVRWYLALFDDGEWDFYKWLGLSPEYYKANNTGGFALEQHLRYIAEVRVGETVSIRVRLLARSEKLMHTIAFMVNEDTGKLAATMEALGAHADLSVRRTAPWPRQIAARLDEVIAEQNALGWEAPVCGLYHI